jgi:hypothetical protein
VLVLLPPQGSDIKATFSCENGLSAEALALYSKGWVVGQDGGVVTLFEKDDKETFRRARSFTIQGHAVKIKCARTPRAACIILDCGPPSRLLTLNAQLPFPPPRAPSPPGAGMWHARMWPLQPDSAATTAVRCWRTLHTSSARNTFAAWWGPCPCTALTLHAHCTRTQQGGPQRCGVGGRTGHPRALR